MTSIFGAGILAVLLNPMGVLLIAACFFLGRMLWKLPMYAAHNGRFVKVMPTKFTAFCESLENNQVKHFAVTFVVCGLVFVIFNGFNIFTHTPSTWYGWMFAVAYLALMGNGLYHLAEDVFLLWNSRLGRGVRGAYNGVKNDQGTTPPNDTTKK